jgi:hypothetical protein
MEPAQEGAASSDNSATDTDKLPTNAQLLRMLVMMKLKLIASYVLDGFAPVVAVIAVIVAVMAINGNKAGHAELAQNTARIASLSESLLAAKAEVEKLKALIAQEKLLKEEERKKRDEELAKIIQGVSKLQTKLKITPTLEEQFRQPVAALTAPAPVVAAMPATLAPVAPASPPVNAASPAVKPVSLPAKTNPPPATALASTTSDKKPGSQKEILKEAIEQFNKK